MRLWRDGRDGWTARVVASAFAVQMLLIAFSVGAEAGPAPRDQFGNVICSADPTGARKGTSGPASPHGGKLDCCTLGCPMFGGPLAPPPAGGSLSAARPPILRVPFAVRENAVAAGVPFSPHSARAPPSTA